MAYSHTNMGLGNNVGYGLAFGLYNPMASQNNSNQLMELQKQIQQMQKSAAPAPQTNPGIPSSLANQYNRLSMQASDALYGGILGYQPKPITSPTGNQYQPPTNQGFQFPFGLLNRNFLGS